VSPNLVNLERVSKGYGTRVLLDEVSLGLAAGERVGVVGRNGDGKSTLLRVLTRLEPPDAGRVTHQRDLRLGYLAQGDDLDPDQTVRHLVLRDRADHEWAGDARARGVVEHLLADLPLDRAVGGLSGGERRRSALARLLLDDHDLIVLDEPTNHLDIESVSWLARHLNGLPSALLVVTHDRWFLDEVSATTWEVHDGAVDAYDGGYAAFVLAKAVRLRQADASAARRRNLVRKELAWLRRGAPARTSKPRFRVEAANTLISDVPAPRDQLELRRFSAARLGKDVVDLEDVSVTMSGRELMDRVTFHLAPGERLGVVGVNGSGKTTFLRLLAGEIRPDSGRRRQGRTVALAHLRQSLEGLPGSRRVLASVEEIRRVTRLAGGAELTATSMLERFGFAGDRLTARIGDLSGGERRRLQMLRLLMGEPNVLLLDEPTNDLDIEVLTVVEDYLDTWPGSLVVVSHDRYFLERVCDEVWALLGDGSLRMLPRGVEEYLERRASAAEPAASAVPPGGRSAAADQRAAKKELARLERQLSRISAREASLLELMTEHASDFAKLAEMDTELRAVQAEKAEIEEAWLTAAELLEAEAD
jgi:ATP-binding cassette subfamily F protein uup